MASKAAESANVCPVCLETRPLKIAGRCKHSFCTECLTTAIGSADGEVFSCPTCQADCPRPWDGVEGQEDFTGEVMATEELGTLVVQGRTVERKDDIVETAPGDKRGDKEITTEDVDVKCSICRHRKKAVQAVNLCVECRNLHICEDCTEVHARNKATQGHVVIRFRSEIKKEEAMCEKHDSPLDSYCHDCKQAVCVACVMLEHGDHTIEKLGDFVDTKVESLENMLEDREKRLEKLEELEEELILLTRIAPVVDKQDVLIKEIEDHAQKCIDKIVKWKEDLKEQVKADYQIIREIPECLKKVSEMVQKLQVSIETAVELLAATEHQPVYLDRLLALQVELEALAETDVDGEDAGYMGQVQQLHNNDCCFTSVTMDSYGAIYKAPAKKGEVKPKEIFTLTMQVDSNEKFIPCVANLGQRFAVAHPTREGELSDAIDIYEFPGKLIHTFKDHVPSLYDMSATPDGKLAVLSDGTEGTSRCVKLFDSETGYIRSTLAFDIPKPLSLGVTLQHQYVILCDNEEGERQITVVDKDGRVEHTHVNKEKIGEKRIKPSRITCGGRFIYVTGKLGCFAYEIKDTGIHAIVSPFKFAEPDNDHGVDISVNLWDDLFVTFILKNDLNLVNVVKDKEMKSKWTIGKEHMLVRDVTGANRETRASTRGSHIVVSHSQTIGVSKYK